MFDLLPVRLRDKIIHFLDPHTARKISKTSNSWDYAYKSSFMFNTAYYDSDYDYNEYLVNISDIIKEKAKIIDPVIHEIDFSNCWNDFHKLSKFNFYKTRLYIIKAFPELVEFQVKELTK